MPQQLGISASIPAVAEICRLLYNKSNKVAEAAGLECSFDKQ
jgi:hypothetical protein